MPSERATGVQLKSFLIHDQEIRHEGIKYVMNQLYEASESGDLEVVQLVLKCGIILNTTN